MSARPWRLWWEDGEHVRRAAYKYRDAATRDAERLPNAHMTNADTHEYIEYRDGSPVTHWVLNEKGIPTPKEIN